MRARVSAIFVSVLLLVVQGCGVSPFPASAAVVDGGNTDPSEVPLTEGTLFALHVLMAPDADPSNFTLVESCEIPAGTVTGTSMSCTVEIPEGTLHFSRLKLQMVVPSGTSCQFVVFKPYGYQASNTVDFTPEWSKDDEVDCDGSVLPMPLECYSGPAQDIVTEFPTFNSLVITPTGSGLEEAWVIESAHTRKRYNSNRWTNNTLIARGANIASPNGDDAYIANSMQDWEFDCRDVWYDFNYQIALTIQDENTQGGVCNINLSSCNQFPNWNSTQTSEPQ